MFALGFGMGLGSLVGLSVGPHVFKHISTPDYRYLSELADVPREKQKDTGGKPIPHVVVPPHGTLVQAEMRGLHDMTPPWLYDPQFHRMAMINKLTQIVWPTMTKAVLDAVLKDDMVNLKPILEKELWQKYGDSSKFFFVEDIFLGNHSLRHGEAQEQFKRYIQDKVFTMGKHAPKLEGIRVIPSSDDELLLDLTAVWGASCKFNIGAFLRIGPMRLYVPLEISNVSFRADLRVRAAPLVEQIPVAGGVTVSLLRVPTVDCRLSIIKGIDLMALPFVPQLLNFGLKFVLEPMLQVVPGIGLIYPNGMSFPIMKDFGVPQAPAGALEVVVLRAYDLTKGNSDPYFQVEVRPGRTKRTQTGENPERAPRPGAKPGSNKPELTSIYTFNEKFVLIVDSPPEEQSLKLLLWEDDLGALDTHVGTAEMRFDKSCNLLDPRKPGRVVRLPPRTDVSMSLKIYKVAKKGAVAGATAAAGRTFSKAKSGVSRLFSRKRGGSDKDAALAADLASGVSTAGPSTAVSGSEAGGALSTSGPTGPSTLSTAPSLSGAAAAASAASALAAAAKEHKSVGVVEIKVRFIPFTIPTYDDEVAEEREKAGVAGKTTAAPGKDGEEAEPKPLPKDKRMSMFPPPPSRTLHGSDASASSKGVLTVQLVRCVDMAPEGAKDLSLYVRFKLVRLSANMSAEDHNTADEVQTSSVVVNEINPRWGDKFDFVLIPVESELYIEVLNVASGLFGKKKEESKKDVSMGKQMIRVSDVARNGVMKDTWPLQDTDRGAIELKLNWQACHLGPEEEAAA